MNTKSKAVIVLALSNVSLNALDELQEHKITISILRRQLLREKQQLAVPAKSCSKKVNFQVLDKVTYHVPVQELKLHSLPEEQYYITLHCITLSFTFDLLVYNTDVTSNYFIFKT